MPENIRLIKKSYKKIIFTVTCVADISKAYFMVKRSLSDLDAAALVNLSITGTPATGGQITDTTQPTATLEFFVVETALDAVPRGDYVWCLKCISGGHAYTPPEGYGKLTVAEAGVVAVS